MLSGFVMDYEFVGIGELRDKADVVNEFLKYVKVRVVSMLGCTMLLRRYWKLSTIVRKSTRSLRGLPVGVLRLRSS